MWNRKELKEQGKTAFKRNYWKSILVGLIDLLTVGGVYVGSNVSQRSIETTWGDLSPSVLSSAILVLLVILVLVAVVQIVLRALLIGPLQVGSARFKLNALHGTGNVSELGSGFDSNFKNNFKTMFFSSLYITLWSLLFIIPGVVKSYEYRMVPYLLAENPDMDYKVILAKSKNMMQGNKWNTFVLDLSFLPWEILGSITFGLVSIFYVAPYESMTDAALYEALKAAE